MNVLVIGGGGYVGSIVNPALESAHHVTYLDRHPVAGAEDRTFVGNLMDEPLIARALQGQDAVIYMALGRGKGEMKPVGLGRLWDVVSYRVLGRRKRVSDTCELMDPAFDVNLRDQYRVLKMGLEMGIRKFITISTLNVYGGLRLDYVLDEENTPVKAFKSPYGISKRLAEELYVAAAQNYEDGVFLALRFNLPTTEQAFARVAYDPAKGRANRCAIGPKDSGSLLLAGLAFNQPGCHILITTGDLAGVRYSNAKATELLGWTPVGA